MKAINNLLEGHCKAARQAAKSVNYLRLVRAAHDDYGYSLEESHTVAAYLKGQIDQHQYLQELRTSLFAIS